MATAAELREATIQMHCDSGGCDSVRGGPPGSHDSVGCHLAGMLDDLMAAVRAEALDEYRDALSDVIKAFDDSRDGRGWDNAAVDAVRALVSK